MEIDKCFVLCDKCGSMIGWIMDYLILGLIFLDVKLIRDVIYWLL